MFDTGILPNPFTNTVSAAPQSTHVVGNADPLEWFANIAVKHDVNGPATATPPTYAEVHCTGKARESKNTWKELLSQIRSQCRQRGLDTCRELREHLQRDIRCQKQALIMFLHIMRADGLITSQSDKAVKGMWVSFSVVIDKAREFQLRLLELFGHHGQNMSPNTKGQRTINNSFSGIGYRPNGIEGKPFIWQQAYDGELDFVSA
jgi:hypothetical protein